MKITSDEMLQIAKRLEQYHAIFYQLFEIGEPNFTSSIQTAAVTFNKGKNVGFIINPKFWKTLSDKQKAFVVSHECLHVILDHGMRAVDAKCPEACNIAMDVVVNELLVNEFGFHRKEIDPKNRLCWKDKIFPDKKIEENETFEYYYNRLEKAINKMSGGSGGKFGKPLDDHSQMNGGSLSKDIAERLGSKLSDEEKEQLKKAIESQLGQQAGTQAGNISKIMEAGPKIIKRTWERVIERWTRKAKGDDIEEQWVHPSRRLSCVDSNIILPSEYDDQEARTTKKVKLFLFIDSSGSCEELVKDFWKAYESIPKDVFDVTCFCFDDYVYDVDPKVRKLFGFGGTDFAPIETKVIEKKYPDAVFVFTDGYGSHVKPKHPNRWYWFLSKVSERKYIPTQSKIFSLSDFS